MTDVVNLEAEPVLQLVARLFLGESRYHGCPLRDAHYFLIRHSPLGYHHPVDLEMTPAMQKACATRDVAEIFRLLIQGGMTQCQIADLVSMSQSEVSEILKGRWVMSYDVLVRIANGLHIPRGLMGLAYTVQESPEEVEEDVERRKLLAIAGTIMFGAPVFGEPAALTVRRVLMDPPTRIGAGDVTAYETTVTRLGHLDREAGGMAARVPLVATAAAGEQMLNAQAAPEVHTKLRYAVAEAHRLAGWASGDIGLIDHCRYHMHQALDFAAGDPVIVAGVLCSAGDMEKHHGASNDALKMFQLAEIGSADADPQVGAVIKALSATAYQKLGYSDKAKHHLQKARFLFSEGQPERSGPFFAFSGKGAGVLAAGESKLGDFEAARVD
ncbi:MAG: helix-turn-helix domain-containing protein, partial [Pseudonocardiaceae bacterium]